MFSPLRSAAICCLTLALPVSATAQAGPSDLCRQNGTCKDSVIETLVLDPTAKPKEGDGDKVTIKSLNPADPGGDRFVTNPTKPPAIPDPARQPSTPEPVAKAPDPVVQAPNPTVRPPEPTEQRLIQPVRNPGAPPLLGGPETPRDKDRTPAIDLKVSTEAETLKEMTYITFTAPSPGEDYEVSLINNMRGTGRIRVTTDYGPVYCNGFVFGPSVVATSYACVPGILDNPSAYATEIEEIRIVFDHVFPDQRLWTARGYVLTLDTDLSSEKTGIAILHIAEPRTRFASDRIQRVGQERPDPRAPLYMLSHPRGGSMQIQHCNSVPIDPAYATARTFEHGCQSDYGDLGAPIYDAATGAVVGLHLSQQLSTGRRFATGMTDLANWIGEQQ